MTSVDAETARRATVGTVADILEAGGTPVQAAAVREALERWLLGDIVGAHEVLSKAFQNGMVASLIRAFDEGSNTPMRDDAA